MGEKPEGGSSISAAIVDEKVRQLITAVGTNSLKESQEAVGAREGQKAIGIEDVTSLQVNLLAGRKDAKVGSWDDNAMPGNRSWVQQGLFKEPLFNIPGRQLHGTNDDGRGQRNIRDADDMLIDHLAYLRWQIQEARTMLRVLLCSFPAAARQGFR